MSMSPSENQERTEDIQNINEIHGRAIQQQERNRGYLKTLTKDPKLLFWILVILWVLVVRGFENQTSGTLLSIPVFQRRFGELLPDGSYKISTNWQSALTGGPSAAGIFGSWAGSYLADIYGYKKILLIATIINIVSVGIEFASKSVGMFFAGKTINFVSIGVFQNLCTAYVAEISPLSIRSSVIGFCNLCQCFGPFITAIMSSRTTLWDTDWAWKSIICAQWGFSVVALIGQIFMPESPVYFVRKNQIDAARNSLERLYSLKFDADSHLEKIKITLHEAESLSKEGNYIDCFKGTNRRRTLISIMIFLSQAMAGVSFVQSYGPLMLQYMGIDANKSFQIQIGAQILSMSGAIVSFLVADLVGRRPMFIGGISGLAGLLLCMAISGSFPDRSAAVTASVGFYTMYNFFFNAGVGSVAYALGGELPTSVLRAKSLAISLSTESAVNTMWSFVCPYLINPGYAHLSAKVGYVFGAFMVIWVGLAWAFVPETRKRTYEELDELFENHVPARKFVTYVTNAERQAEGALQLEEKTFSCEHEEHV